MIEIKSIKSTKNEKPYIQVSLKEDGKKTRVKNYKLYRSDANVIAKDFRVIQNLDQIQILCFGNFFDYEGNLIKFGKFEDGDIFPEKTWNDVSAKEKEISFILSKNSSFNYAEKIKNGEFYFSQVISMSPKYRSTRYQIVCCLENKLFDNYLNKLLSEKFENITLELDFRNIKGIYNFETNKRLFSKDELRILDSDEIIFNRDKIEHEVETSDAPSIGKIQNIHLSSNYRKLEPELAFDYKIFKEKNLKNKSNFLKINENRVIILLLMLIILILIFKF